MGEASPAAGTKFSAEPSPRPARSAPPRPAPRCCARCASRAPGGPSGPAAAPPTGARGAARSKCAPWRVPTEVETRPGARPGAAGTRAGGPRRAGPAPRASARLRAQPARPGEPEAGGRGGSPSAFQARPQVAASGAGIPRRPGPERRCLAAAAGLVGIRPLHLPSGGLGLCGGSGAAQGCTGLRGAGSGAQMPGAAPRRRPGTAPGWRWRSQPGGARGAPGREQ